MKNIIALFEHFVAPLALFLFIVVILTGCEASAPTSEVEELGATKQNVGDDYLTPTPMPLPNRFNPPVNIPFDEGQMGNIYMRTSTRNADKLKLENATSWRVNVQCLPGDIIVNGGCDPLDEKSGYELDSNGSFPNYSERRGYAIGWACRFKAPDLEYTHGGTAFVNCLHIEESEAE